jgi:hypothetical protein
MDRFSGASDTAIKQDYDQVREWLSDDSKKPFVVADAQGTVDELPLRKTEKGALYKAIMNMTALNGARDFFTGQAPTLAALNDHHIFPVKSGLQLSGENAILNRTLISEVTNSRIKNKRPSQYLQLMETELGSADALRSVLESHFIDERALTAMRQDDYGAFLAAREEVIKTEMKRRVA